MFPTTRQTSAKQTPEKPAAEKPIPAKPAERQPIEKPFSGNQPLGKELEEEAFPFERPTHEKPSFEKVAIEKPPPAKPLAEKSTPERTPLEKSTPEKQSGLFAEKQPLEKTGFEKLTPEKITADKPTLESLAVGKEKPEVSSDVNLSLTIYPNGDLKLVDRPIPQPKEGEVQIKIEDCGICGTDLHIVRERSFGEWQVTKPVVLGHESSGVVSKLGPGVTTLKVGDRVAIEPNIPCFNCPSCLSGHYNVCPSYILTGLPTFPDGSLARYRIHDARLCHKFPDHVSFEEGAIMEPLSVAVHAAEQVQLSFGEKVLISGAGNIGLLTLLVAKGSGASQIVITDVNQKKLDLAKKLGADFTILGGKEPKALAAKIIETLGSPVDVAFDCVGLADTLNVAIYSTRSAGRVGIVGLDAKKRELDIHNAITREIKLIGSMTYVNSFPKAIALVASGKVDVRPLVSHRIPLEQAPQAFEIAHKGEGNKVIIKVGRK